MFDIKGSGLSKVLSRELYYNPVHRVILIIRKTNFSTKMINYLDFSTPKMNCKDTELTKETIYLLSCRYIITTTYITLSDIIILSIQFKLNLLFMKEF